MKSSSRFFAVLLGTAFVAASAPLVAQDVHVDYNHTWTFNKVKTYGWLKVQASDPLLEPRITAAVERILTSQGLHLADKNPDVLITAVDLTVTPDNNDSINYASFYRGLNGYNWHPDWGSSGFLETASEPSGIPTGTLVVDMYDPSTHKVVWRGIAAQPPATKERKVEDSIDKAAAQMLARFPPKSGGPVAPNQVEAPSGNNGTPVTGR